MGDEDDHDDENDCAQAESTRLQLANKRRCMFTPSSRKKKPKKQFVVPVCMWVGRGEEEESEFPEPGCKQRECKYAAGSLLEMLG